MAQTVSKRASARKAIPPRVRFDVFKRDKFTCQYCGKSAPDVVLECDHIRPVADGGTNDILNLITSCKPCNGGKGAVPLSSSAALDKQSAMLAELEDRRQQIEMMLQWRDELQNHKADVVQQVADRIARHGYSLSESGKADLVRWLKKYTAEEIISAADESFEIYLQFDGDVVDGDSWSTAFRKIPGVIAVRKESVSKPYLKRLFYIKGILQRRLRVPFVNRMNFLEHLARSGVDLDALESLAKRIRTIQEFDDACDRWLDSIGKPF